MSKPRLLDLVLAIDQTEASRNKLRSSMAILCDNVASYFEGLEKGTLDMKPDDFPNVAPPAPVMWFEFKATKAPSGPSLNRTLFERVGFALEGMELDRNNPPAAVAGWAKSNPARWAHMLEVVASGQARWMVGGKAVIQKDGELISASRLFFFVASDGSLVPINTTSMNPKRKGQVVSTMLVFTAEDNIVQECMATLTKYDPSKKWLESEAREIASYILSDIRRQFNVVLLALSFMHCKNTVIRDSSPRINKPQKKNRHKPPASGVRFKVLEIEPMKEVLRRQGGSEKSGLQQALHICRGHFKDYREHGLFGRQDMKGTFWFPMHVRGDKKRGAVVKDYSVNQPGVEP